MTLAPIETRYAGCAFRSRLEARWAVFFDVWGLKWRYEPDTFQLPSGRLYLPDFYADGVGYIECKPNRDADDGKLGELAEMLSTDHMQAFVIYGEVPAPSEVTVCGLTWSSPATELIMSGTDEAEYWFAQCPVCGLKGITYQGRYPRLSCPCSRGLDDRAWNERAVTGLRVACVASRSTRFENL